MVAVWESNARSEKIYGGRSGFCIDVFMGHSSIPVGQYQKVKSTASKGGLVLAPRGEHPTPRKGSIRKSIRKSIRNDKREDHGSDTGGPEQYAQLTPASSREMFARAFPMQAML